MMILMVGKWFLFYKGVKYKFHYYLLTHYKFLVVSSVNQQVLRLRLENFMPLWNVPFLKVIRQERNKGRSVQPVFQKWQPFNSFLGGVVAISSLGILSNWSGYELLVAPFGASTFFLFVAKTILWLNREILSSGTY